MEKLTEEEWENIQENFESTWLLDAVRQIGDVRGHLGDGENWEPPQIRTDLLKLHSMAMDVINSGWTNKIKDMFDMAIDLEMQVDEIIETMEAVQETLSKLTDLYPESLNDF